MRSHAVVIVRIVFQNPTQMFLVQDNDCVQTLAPDRSDQPFGKAVLPRRSRCNWLVSDTHGTQSARDDSAVDSISISDPIARSIGTPAARSMTPRKARSTAIRSGGSSPSPLVTTILIWVCAVVREFVFVFYLHRER